MAGSRSPVSYRLIVFWVVFNSSANRSCDNPFFFRSSFKRKKSPLPIDFIIPYWYTIKYPETGYFIGKGDTNVALFDKIKQTASAAKEKVTEFAEEKQLGEKFAQAKENAKKSWDESTAAMKANSEENKALKQPLEGAIIRYEVIYLGGLPEYPKAKHGSAVGLNVMPDKFVFTKTGTSKDWFTEYQIPYDKISEITIEKRTISNAEMFLGGGNDPNQQQENNICIAFEAQDGAELVLRVEMLTGTTIYGQATKCREFMDILRQNSILKLFKKKADAVASAQPDVLGQIEKLAGLKAAGVLSEEEFNQKKAELLEKL